MLRPLASKTVHPTRLGSLLRASEVVGFYDGFRRSDVHSLGRAADRGHSLGAGETPPMDFDSLVGWFRGRGAKAIALMGSYACGEETTFGAAQVWSRAAV